MEPVSSIPDEPVTPTPTEFFEPGRRLEWGFRHYFFGFIVPALWVCLSLPSLTPWRPIQRTRQVLKDDVAALHAFLAKYEKNPSDLSILRSFARGNKLPFSAYDAYGERMDYLRFDNQHFLLRSFGDDQIQNSLTSSIDLGIINWGERPNIALTYSYPELPQPGFYPAALLAGADSPDHHWLARVYSDAERGHQHLVVRHLLKDGLFMVAPHDAVEEYLWLPTGDRLIFTATGSSRYRDGIYLWDLRTDTTIDVLDVIHTRQLSALTHVPNKLWVSLAGVSKRGPLVYFYMRPRHYGSLSPLQFFRYSSMIAVAVPDGEKPRLATVDEFPASVDAASLTHPLQINWQIQGQGTHVQREWLQLPTTSDVEHLLLAWHEFSDKAAGSPLYPYSLWLLATFYGESFAAMQTSSGHEHDALRSYGTEVARALLNYAAAPTYLKGLSLYAYEELMDGKVLPYQLARFTVKGSGPTGPSVSDKTTSK